jgi:hypothetical protein
VILEKKAAPQTDILFAISTTASGAQQTFTRMKNAINYIIDDQGLEKLRYSLMIFGSQPSTIVDFKQRVRDVNALKRFVDLASIQSGSPDFKKALDESKKIFENSDRPEARKILVFIVDKSSTSSPVEIKNAAQPLDKKGVRVIPVIVGPDVDVDEMEKITPDKLGLVKVNKDVDPEVLGKILLERVLRGKVQLDKEVECKRRKERKKYENNKHTRNRKKETIEWQIETLIN